MFRRNVQSIQDLLEKYLRDEGLETPLLQKRIIAAWETVTALRLQHILATSLSKTKRSL